MRFLPLALAGAAAAAPLAAQSPWHFEPPGRVTPLGTFSDTTLFEASAAAASRRQPGVIWTLNDSGNPPWVYAVDTAGRTLEVYAVRGAQNFDWESLTIAPCPAGSCLLVGDTGDNPERRASVTLYRIPEPTLPTPPTGTMTPSAPAESLVVRYPDGAHDNEAIYADSLGTVYFVTKGRSTGILLFRVPAAAWGSTGPVTAELVDTLPIVPDMHAGRWVTDAAISPDGRRVAVRTYETVFLFRVGADGRLTPDNGLACTFGSTLEPQGEGVTWLDNRRLLFTSESSPNARGTLFLVECGQP